MSYVRDQRKRNQSAAREKKDADERIARARIPRVAHEHRVDTAQACLFEASSFARGALELLRAYATVDSGDLLLIEIAASDLQRLATRLRVFEERKPMFKSSDEN